MTPDVENRLRSADPLARETSEQHERDRSWLQSQIRAAHTTPSPDAVRSPHRRGTLVAVAAAAAVLTGVAGVAMTGVLGSDESHPAAEEPMELALAPEAPTMASCIPFSVEALAGMPVAFSGTVTQDGGERVLIQVDRWYQGGDANQVSLVAPDSSMMSLDGMLDFEEGERYLVTAGSGVVNYCGFSAAWTAPMADTYEQAFDAG